MAVHSAVRHSALVPLLHVIRGRHGPILVYPWVDGVRLRGSRRTSELPIHAILAAIYALIDVHLAVERTGFVSIDLYDGIFSTRSVSISSISMSTKHHVIERATLPKPEQRYQTVRDLADAWLGVRSPVEP
jgi:hypothetical protein